MQAETDIRDALSHPIRLQILRSLATSSQGRSLAELALEIPCTCVSMISYHLHFLSGCGTVSLSTSPWRDGSPTWRYGTDFARQR